ncbi:hypothetical protein [Humidisolicoccus flavus]|uniref:hypothetical protein n=1 Tax=Humidisolicoccus flavus TaxID=3111414 RepID=UPI0032558F12
MTPPQQPKPPGDGSIPPLPPPAGYLSERESLAALRGDQRDPLVPRRPPMQASERAAGEPPELDPNEAPTPIQRISAVCILLLVLIACIPHLVAPIVAGIFALVALPLSWMWARVTVGRRRSAFLTTAGIALIALVLSIIMPIIYLEMGTITIPDNPPLP